ncbi:MAG: TolC family protein [Terracidiphilus sp.]
MAALLAAAPALGLAQVSLVTVVDLAQRESSAVQLARSEVARARAALDQTKDVIIPSLQLNTGLPVLPSVGFTGSPPSIWSATVQSLIYGIPQRRFIAAAGSDLKASALSLKDAREQVALDASTAYIELDTVTQELVQARQQEQYATRLVEIAQQRAEAGIDPLTELLQARLTASELRLKRIRLESRAGVLAKQLAELTGLPVGTITPDHASIPEIPRLDGDLHPLALASIESAQMSAHARELQAKGDREIGILPQLGFFVQYNRVTTLLNDVNSYFKRPLPSDNVASGISIQIPLVDFVHRAKARQSAAEALRARVEVEQAQRQNEVQIAQLTGGLRELGALAEVTSLRQQIAEQQLKAILTSLEVGNGATATAGAPAQLTPKDEQLARIDERHKAQEALDASFELARARLNLLRALGHMQDWLDELHGK